MIKYNLFFCSLLLLFPHMTYAGSRQLGTGAVTQIEGSSGSGIVPWATIAGYGESDEYDVRLSYTLIDTGDYRFGMKGTAWGWRNRIEFSLAQQELDLVTLGPAIGLPGEALRQDVIGLKVRLAGNLVYSKIPQFAFGVQYKRNKSFLIPSLVGALDDDGFDYYFSATKLFLAKPAGLNGFATLTLRSTRANETGLLGFGGDLSSGRHLEIESSLGVFISQHVAIGFDFRGKSSNLSFAPEDNWRDIFIAWLPNRHLSIVAAYADLGGVATLPNQKGFYLSLSGGF